MCQGKHIQGKVKRPGGPEWGKSQEASPALFFKKEGDATQVKG